MIWTPTIDRLRVPIRRTTERALKRLDKDPPRDVLLRLAHDVWTTASRAGLGQLRGSVVSFEVNA